MKKTFETYRNPCVIKMQIENPQNDAFDIRIQASHTKGTLYSRTISDSPTVAEYLIPLPLVMPEATCEVKGNVRVLSFKVEPLVLDIESIPDHIHDYVLFASQIALLLETMPNGMYQSDCKKYWANLSPYVLHPETNKPIMTPASVNRIWQKYYLSRELLLPMTVPMRMFILLHEYFHAFLERHDDLDHKHFAMDEIEVDRRAAHIFFLLGFPFTECAKTLLLMYNAQGTDEQAVRVRQVLEIIKTEFSHN